MISQYYYFVASLPLLDFHKQATFSYSEFLKESARHLSVKDFSLFTKATLQYDPVEAPHPLLQRWADFNRRLKNEIVRFRAKKFSKDSVDFMRGDHYVPLEMTDIVSHVTKLKNPLEAEKALDFFRWEKLEELSSGHFFDLEFLIVYALKLQILDRHHVVSSPQGQVLFEHYQTVEIFENIHV
jgi:hypothetical protein